ncbi:MAG TPA: chemotaxis protein CheW [Candidatus Acidoferrales bacterium]
MTSSTSLETGAKRRPSSRRETVILFVVAGQMFAIAADSVQEIRSTDSLSGAANEMEQAVVPKVRHTIERNRRTYFVVNAGAHFNLPATRPALVLILRELRVAVLVDRIERMAEIPAVYALPQAFSGPERRWYRGLAFVDDLVIPVIQPAGFLTLEEFQKLDRMENAAAAERQEQEAAQA